MPRHVLVPVWLIAAAIAMAPHAAGATPERSETRWYGSHVIIADALATSVMLVGAGLRSDATIKVGAASYVLVAPIVHTVHGNGAGAIGSLVLRTALPLAGSYAGIELCDAKDGDIGNACVGSASLGLIAGMVVAMTVDIALLARGKVPPREHRGASWTLGAAPRADGGFAVAVGGVF